MKHLLNEDIVSNQAIHPRYLLHQGSPGYLSPGVINADSDYGVVTLLRNAKIVRTHGIKWVDLNHRTSTPWCKWYSLAKTDDLLNTFKEFAISLDISCLVMLKVSFFYSYTWIYLCIPSGLNWTELNWTELIILSNMKKGKDILFFCSKGMVHTSSKLSCEPFLQVALLVEHQVTTMQSCSCIIVNWCQISVFSPGVLPGEKGHNWVCWKYTPFFWEFKI